MCFYYIYVIYTIIIKQITWDTKFVVSINIVNTGLIDMITGLYLQFLYQTR